MRRYFHGRGWRACIAPAALEGRVATTGDFVEIPHIVRPMSADELDAAGYLAANPDVRAAGAAAADHFAWYGQAEGRWQWVNSAAIARLRERKLARLRFRPAAAPRAEGAAANFLPRALADAFLLPDDPPISSNDYGGHLVELIRANPQKLFLDVGAGLRHTYFSNVVNTEIHPWATTDVVCVGEDLPFEADQFDYVLSFAVLEHTRRPWDVAREMCRVLKPGGEIWVDYPFLQPVHGYPHHYFNATPMGSASLFEPYCDIRTLEIFDNNHPIRALRWILEEWRHGLPADLAARFGDLRIADLLATSADAQMDSFYSRALNEAARRVIAAGSGLVAITRPVAIAPPDAAARETARLAGALAAVHASTSWRLTAPLRALGKLLGRR
jgi:SAM-dependent methyltransferase